MVKTLLMVVISAFYLITWGGISEAWAKGPAGKSGQSGVSSSITTPPVNAGASSNTDAQAKKKSSGDNYLKEPGSLEFPNIK